MTLTELKYIVAVARERHFGRAAKACFVSQSTLSIGVKKLEEELGTVLFERGRNEVSLTPKGEQIIEQAQQALEEVDRIKQIARQEKGQLVGTLRIGAIHTIGPYLFPGLIPILHEKVPQMPLVVKEDFTANLTTLLKQGQLDVIVISYPYDEPGIVTMPLYDEPFVVLLPSSPPVVRAEDHQAGIADAGEHHAAGCRQLLSRPGTGILSGMPAGVTKGCRSAGNTGRQFAGDTAPHGHQWHRYLGVPGHRLRGRMNIPIACWR